MSDLPANDNLAPDMTARCLVWTFCFVAPVLALICIGLLVREGVL